MKKSKSLFQQLTLPFFTSPIKDIPLKKINSAKDRILKDKGKIVQRKKRKCLRCDKLFNSRYDARICKNCKDVNRLLDGSLGVI